MSMPTLLCSTGLIEVFDFLRISTIMELIPPEKWKHVISLDNPAPSTSIVVEWTLVADCSHLPPNSDLFARECNAQIACHPIRLLLFNGGWGSLAPGDY